MTNIRKKIAEFSTKKCLESIEFSKRKCYNTYDYRRTCTVFPEMRRKAACGNQKLGPKRSIKYAGFIETVHILSDLKGRSS